MGTVPKTGESVGYRRMQELRRALGLGAALAIGLPVAALVRLDPATWHVGWALRPAGPPDGNWPGSWSPVARTAAEQQMEALGAALTVLAVLALLVWLAALGDGVLGSLRSVVGDRHRWAVKSAIGASRRQLRREVALHRLRSSGIACVLGVAGAAGACELLGRMLPSSLTLAAPSGAAMLVGAPLVPAVLVVTLLTATGLPLLLLPSADQLRRPARLLGIGRKAGEDRVRRSDGRVAWAGELAWWLAVCQVGAGLAIIVSAAFLVRGASQPSGTAASFPYARDTLVLRVTLPEGGDRAGLWAEIDDAVSRSPGVRLASVSTPGALLGLGSLDRVGVDCPGCGGGGLGAPITVGLARHAAVDDDFFEMLAVPVLDGEAISGSDGEGEANDEGHGVVIDRTFRRRLFQGVEPRGRQVWLRGALPLREPGFRVRGVADVPATGGFSARRHSLPVVYASLAEHPPGEADVAVRMRAPGDAAARRVTSVVQSTAPGAEIEILGPLSEMLEAQTAAVRLVARVTMLLGVVAFVLALFGSNDAVIERVRGRTAEIGLRRAVGARRRAIIRLVLTDAAGLIGAGVLVGLAVGLSFNRAVPMLVENVDPLSVPALAAFALLLVALGFAATTAAARRAVRLDPVAALRE